MATYSKNVPKPTGAGLRNLGRRPSLRMDVGGSFGDPMNTTPMSTQNKAAFDGLQQSPGYTPPAPVAAPAAAAPKPLASQDQRMGMAMSLLGSGHQMAMPASLQMADGGGMQPVRPAPSPWSIAGIANTVKSALTPTPKTPEQLEYERGLAEYKARSAAERAAPAPMPAASQPVAVQPAPQPLIQGQFNQGQNVLQQRQKLTMGLRNGGSIAIDEGMGGPVPGRGQGDKIPAKYEPGEFVVSNDMLDAAPGLREQLHGLRADVLADKGMTPAQADAKAVNSGDGNQTQDNPVAQGRGGYDTRAGGTQGQRTAGLPHRVSLRALDGFEVTERPWTSADSRTFAAQPGPGNPNVGSAGSAEAQAFRNARTAAPAPVPAAPQAAAPTQSASYRAGQRVGQTLRAGGNGVGAAGALAGIAANSADDSMQTPTENYRRRFGMDPNQTSVGGDLAARAGGVMTDLGAHILDTPVNILNAGSRMLGGKGDMQLPGGSFQDIISRNDGEGPAPAAPTHASAARPSLRGQNFDDPRRLDMDPSRASLGASRDFTNELGAVPKTLPSDLRDGVIYKTVGPNGNPVYSGRNVSGNAQFVDGKGATTGSRSGVSTVPGMSQADIDKTLTNPDGSRWSSQDNAIMAANLRDGVDPYRGTSRQAKTDPMDAVRARAADPNAIGHNGAARLVAQYDANQTAKEGQRLNYDASMAGHAMTRNGNLARLQYDMQKDQRDFGAAQDERDLAASSKARSDLTAHIGTLLPPGPDGKPDLDKSSQYVGALQAHVDQRKGQLEAHLKLHPDDKNAAAEYQGLSKRGLAMLDTSAIQKFIAGQHASEIANQTATGSLTPWGTKAVASDAPIKSLRRQDGLFGHDYVSDRGDVIPGRYIDTEGSTLGFGGRTSLRFRDMISKGQ